MLGVRVPPPLPDACAARLFAPGAFLFSPGKSGARPSPSAPRSSLIPSTPSRARFLCIRWQEHPAWVAFQEPPAYPTASAIHQGSAGQNEPAAGQIRRLPAWRPGHWLTSDRGKPTLPIVVAPRSTPAESASVALWPGSRYPPCSACNPPRCREGDAPGVAPRSRVTQSRIELSPCPQIIQGTRPPELRAHVGLREVGAAEGDSGSCPTVHS